MIRRYSSVCFVFLILMLLASGSGAFRPDNQAMTLAGFQYINYIATSQAKVYFATTNGITIYNKLTNQWEEPLTGADGLAGTDIKRIWVDRFDEHLYAEQSSGLYEYNFTFERWLSAMELPPIDSDDKHLPAPTVMFPPFGFNYLGNGTMVDADSRSFTFSDLVDDGAGNLWIGTWGYGAAKAGTGSKNIELLPYGLLQSAAYTLLDEDSVLWVSGPMLNSRRTGITGIDREENRFTFLETGIHPDFPAVNINCLAGNQSYLIVGTETGMLLINRATQLVDRRIDRRRGFPDDNITSLQTIGQDTVFIGTTGGLLLYEISRDSIGFVAHRQFFNNIIYDLTTSEGYLWIGSNVGAYRLSLETGKLQRYQDPDQVLFNRVFDIQKYDTYIWFASDNGLVRLDLEDGSTTPYRVSSRKLDSRVMDVNDRIAVISNESGITMIFLDDEELRTRDFSIEDGIASTYVYALHLDGDYLWIGTDKGLTRFLWNNPDRVD